MKRLFVGIVMGALFSVIASASSIIPGWTCVGGAASCGTSGANGVVGLSPLATSVYSWVSTNTGTTGVGVDPTSTTGNETNGATLATPLFSANANDALNFYFDFVTSDGAGFADYGWAALMNADNTVAAMLLTAQTEPTGNIIPAGGLTDNILALLTPASVTINDPGYISSFAGNITYPAGLGPVWSPLDGFSGECFDTGCGYTGWVQSQYTIPTTGTYYLQVGVTNAFDNFYDTGLAMDGVTVAGRTIGGLTPEPGTLVLMGIGLGLTVLARRRRQA